MSSIKGREEFTVMTLTVGRRRKEHRGSFDAEWSKVDRPGLFLSSWENVLDLRPCPIGFHPPIPSGSDPRVKHESQLIRGGVKALDVGAAQTA